MTTGILDCGLRNSVCGFRFHEPAEFGAWGSSHVIAAHKLRLMRATIVPDDLDFKELGN